MSSYVVSPQADEDIFEIWRYLCQKASLDVANRVEEEIYSAFEALNRHPGLGHKRSDLTSHAVLFFTVYSYMIVYRVEARLEIVRVLHGRRNVRQILSQ
jgi:plasmid stabilization system protein ParE